MNKAYQYCIRLLSKRDYSEYKLTQKLKERDHTQEEISEVIQVLKEKNYLREAEYARLKIKSWLHRGYGKKVILLKAQNESLSISTQMIEQISLEQGISSQVQIQEIFQVKYAQKWQEELCHEERQKLKRKILSYFQRRGHQLNDVFSLLKDPS